MFHIISGLKLNPHKLSNINIQNEVSASKGLKKSIYSSLFVCSR